MYVYYCIILTKVNNLNTFRNACTSQVNTTIRIRVYTQLKRLRIFVNKLFFLLAGFVDQFDYYCLHVLRFSKRKKPVA